MSATGRPSKGVFRGTARFEVKRQLGTGGMGVVYEAFDRERRTPVALKTLRHTNAEALYRFKREFRALQDIEHPNLVALGELFEEEGTWFFTMELVRGRNLLSYVRNSASTPRRTLVRPSADTLRAERVVGDDAGAAEVCFDERRLRGTLAQLAAGLGVLHGAGIVHRDVKPSNVLVTDEGRVVLLDFGLVTYTSRERQSTQANIIGTAEYMAPEQAAAEEIGPPADWYSVGVILYEALTGHLPHTGRSPWEILLAKHQSVPPAPRELNPEAPADLDALCASLLRSEPARRPSLPALMAALDAEGPASESSSFASSISPSVPFVGRRDELAILDDALSESAQRPCLVIIEGESGVGKTELVRSFTEAQPDDVVILSGRCYEREAVAYKGFDGVADSLSGFLRRLPTAAVPALLPLRASMLPRLFPVLRRVEAIATAPLEREHPDPHEQRHRMFEALRELLARLAQQQRVIILIDDLHWADGDSLTLLREVLCHSNAPSLLVVATTRPMPAGLRDRIAEINDELKATRHISLRDLDPEESTELARLLLPDHAAATIAAIAKEAGGHPLLLHELGRHAMAEGRVVVVSLEDALRSRIAMISPESRRLLEVVCVAGAPITQQVACAASELPRPKFARAVAVLRVAHLARTNGARPSDLIEPYHDRIREALVANLSGDTTRQRHERIAAALHQSGASTTDPQTLVRHLEASGDRRHAAQYAEAAAQRAVSLMAFDQAAQFLETALRLGEYETGKRRALLIELGSALASAQHGKEAAEVFARAAEGANPATALRCRTSATEQWLINGHIEQGLASMRELLARIDVRMPSTPRGALASMIWHRIRLRLRGLRWKERHSSQLSSEEIARLDVYRAAAHGLAVVDSIRGQDFHARRTLLALRSGEINHVASTLALEAGFLAFNGTRGERRSAYAVSRLEQLANASSDNYPRGVYELACGSSHYFVGRFAESVPHYVEAEKLLRDEPGAAWELSNVRLFALFALRQLGRFRELRDSFDEYVADAMARGNRFGETTLRRAVNVIWLVADAPESARSNLERAKWVSSERSFHVQHYYELRALGELALYEGRAGPALEELAVGYERLRKSLLLRCQLIRVITRWLRARLLIAAPSDLGGDVAKAARIARGLGREKVGYARVFGRLVRAGIASHKKDEEAQVRHLVAAAELAEANHMPFHAQVARYRRGAIVGGSEGQDLIDQATAWMHEAGVRNPERMAEVMAPGFDD